MERKKSFRGDSFGRSKNERNGGEGFGRGHRTPSDRRDGRARTKDSDGESQSSRGYRRDGNNSFRKEQRHDSGSNWGDEPKSRFAKPQRRDSFTDDDRSFDRKRRYSGRESGFAGQDEEMREERRGRASVAPRRNSEERKQWRSYASERRSWDGRQDKDTFDLRDTAQNQQEKVVRNFVKKKEETKSKAEKDPNQIRLNRFIANSGVCSRRDADTLIQNGEITVNGKVVTVLGTTISKDDTVIYNGKKLESQRKVYILLNKPKGVVTTVDDPEARTTVMDIISEACDERVYPVGRLDRNTSGLLLLTNDGDLAKKLTHPKYNCRKIYHVIANKPVHRDHLTQMAEGITLEDGPINADEISYVEQNDNSQVGIEIHSGRNRIVRRMFEHFGYEVVKLDRVYFAGLTKQGLPRGKWRFLTDREISKLKAGFFK